MTAMTLIQKIEPAGNDPTSLDAASLAARLNDPVWRLQNLYRIISKGSDDDEGVEMRFVPNRAQRRLIKRLHSRNIVLKARQVGITTLITLLWLDTALFSNEPMRCGIIAHEKDAAEAIFRDKVVYAYEHLPPALRERFPLTKQSASEMQFGHNGASIRVATSMRSGTMHRLLVSELGKISVKYPHKAKEVVTGSLPTVPKNGIAVVESTAEGEDGTFFDMTQIAIATQEQGRALSKRDYKFHFFPWWETPEYSLTEADSRSIIFTDADMAYFLQTEGQIGQALSPGQRAWYVATRRNDFADEAPLMWQEYPSTPKEAFQKSTEGCYYSTQLAAARRQNRIRESLPIEAVPVNTFWDLGKGDMTTIWLHQRVGPENRFIGYYEDSGEDLSHYAVWLQEQGYVYGTHYLPHEAAHRRMGQTPDTSRTLEEMVQALLPGHKTAIVPRVTALQYGIQATRNVFASCYFDEARCRQGLKRLGAYRKRWDKVRGRWSEEDESNDDTHGADAFRQFGQEADGGNVFAGAVVAAAAAINAAKNSSRSGVVPARNWGRRARRGSAMAT